MKKKGKFLIPLLYKLLKKKVNVFVFNNKPTLNIRSSYYFKNCLFKIHNGKNYISNDIKELNEVLKDYSYNFKIGQFSYNKVLIERNRMYIPNVIKRDLKKKKGIDVQLRKKKKTIFTFVN